MKAAIQMETKAADTARSALRQALVDRDRARAAQDDARAAVGRADAVLAGARSELERYKVSLAEVEQARAKELAGAIRRGEKPAVAVDSKLRAARDALGEVESRHAMASSARNTLAGELIEAEANVRRSDQAVTTAAFSVIVEEAAPLAGELQDTLARLISTFDLLTGLGTLGVHFVAGAGPRLPAPIRDAIVQAGEMGHALASLRAQRAILSAGPDAIAAGRWRAYLTLLGENPDAKLDDVAEPETMARSIPRIAAA